MNDEESLKELRVGGMEVHYYILCPRKLWWYVHGMQQEHSGGTAGSESVEMGKLLHETSYPDKTRKDVLIDDLIRLDFTEGGAVHEVKKSKSALKATQFQLLYYLYYLKREKGIHTKGVIDFPKLKQKQELELTPEYETEVEKILVGIQEVRAMPTPPTVENPMPICRKCSYEELCWG